MIKEIKVIFRPTFPFHKNELIYTCNLKEYILDKCQESAKEFNKDFSELKYLCGGDKIDFSSNYKFEDLFKMQGCGELINITIIEDNYPDEEINLMLSEDYVPEWGFKEGLREFLQNQHDGLINHVLTEKNLEIKGIGAKYKNKNNSEDFNKFLNFEFYNKNNDEKLGEITYDEKKQILTIINEGELTLQNLYFGSKKEKKENNEIIGKFGEGMKLGILSLLRLNKNINIISSDKNFQFELCKGHFTTTDQNESKILHCILSRYKNKDMKNKVKVMIGNIGKNEWNDEILKYLWLLDRENFEIYEAEEYGKKIGEVLAAPIFQNKLYSKGIYVQQIEKEKSDKLKSKIIPGFNIYDLKLDRDRNCVQDTYEMREQLGKIYCCALQSNKRYYNYSSKINNSININKKEEQKTQTNLFSNNNININNNSEGERVYVKDYGNIYLSETIIKLLSDDNISFSQDYFFNSTFGYSINKDTADKLWRTWEKMNNIEHRKPPKFQPADFETIKELGTFLEKNKLDKHFYLYFEVKKNLMELFKKSSLFLGYEEKFEKYKMNCVNVGKTYSVNNYLNILEKKVKIPNYDKNFVNFKKFDFGSDIYFYDDNEKKLFFSHTKMDELNNINTKFWVFVVILKTLDIKIENSYYLFKNFFTFIRN